MTGIWTTNICSEGGRKLKKGTSKVKRKASDRGGGIPYFKQKTLFQRRKKKGGH